MNVMNVRGEPALGLAGRGYGESWRASHAGICTPEFLQSRDCAGYLARELVAGKALYLLMDEEPVGVVSLHNG